MAVRSARTAAALAVLGLAVSSCAGDDAEPATAGEPGGVETTISQLDLPPTTVAPPSTSSWASAS